MVSKRKWLWFGRAVAVLLLLSTASACAPKTRRVEVDEALIASERELERELAVKRQMNYVRRISRVSYPILKNATPYCEEFIQPRIGINFSNKYAWGEDYEFAVEVELGLSERLELIGVDPGSAADEAGLQLGDVLLEMNGTPVPVGEKAQPRFQELLDEQIHDTSPIDLRVERDGGELSFTVVPHEICYFPVLLSMGHEINAYADGRNIILTRGMLRFTENDTELSLVIAHELAHNTMEHMKAKRTNYWLGTALDIAAAAAGVNTQGLFGALAANAYSEDFEAEADYVGLYMMAAADLSIEDASAFWRRMAVEHPGSIEDSFMATHPASPERFLAIEKTVEEIRGKQEAGEPLELEYKE